MPQPLARRVSAPDPADCRCLCGNLLARLVPDGVELKCRRCKRTLRLPWSDLDPRMQPQRPAAPSPESHRRAVARPRRDRWLEVCDEGS